MFLCGFWGDLPTEGKVASFGAQLRPCKVNRALAGRWGRMGERVWRAVDGQRWDVGPDLTAKESRKLHPTGV